VEIESSGFTGSYAFGYKSAVIRILRAITKKGLQKKPKSVNILGLSILNYNWENDVAELKRVLALLGIRVISVICAGESLKNIERAGQAQLNLVVNEEYGDTVAAFLEKEYGIPSIGPPIGAPYGLTNSERWFKAVADKLKLSSQSVALESKRVRMKCYPALSRATSTANNIRGSSFAIFGDSSQVVSLVIFLYQYLGMYPSAIGLREICAQSIRTLKSFLSDNSLDCQVLFSPDQYEIVDALNQYNPSLVLGSGIEEHLCPMLKEPVSFIPISFPYYEKIQLTMRPLVGFNGVLTIVEEIINSFN
jgi:nitrogenase molybdenum-iron protein beta chain